MKRLFAITGAMLLSTVIFFVVASAGGGPVQKPVHGTWTGILYDVGPCTDDTFPVEANQTINIGTGVFTHTGRSNFISSFCFPDDEGKGSGWAILTASNGDTLHLLVHQLTIDARNFPVIRWAENETIVGGTGKFEGATGESKSEGIWTFETNPFPFDQGDIASQLSGAPQGWVGTTYEGWIRY